MEKPPQKLQTKNKENTKNEDNFKNGENLEIKYELRPEDKLKNIILKMNMT